MGAIWTGYRMTLKLRQPLASMRINDKFLMRGRALADASSKVNKSRLMMSAAGRHGTSSNVAGQWKMPRFLCWKLTADNGNGTIERGVQHAGVKAFCLFDVAAIVDRCGRQ